MPFEQVILTLSFANLLPTPSAKVKNFSVLIQWGKKPIKTSVTKGG